MGVATAASSIRVLLRRMQMLLSSINDVESSSSVMPCAPDNRCSLPSESSNSHGSISDTTDDKIYLS
eukprot:scaffold249268_cov103-Cyclotella_meneghiniana.AAC.1